MAYDNRISTGTSADPKQISLVICIVGKGLVIEFDF